MMQSVRALSEEVRVEPRSRREVPCKSPEVGRGMVTGGHMELREAGTRQWARACQLRSEGSRAGQGHDSLISGEGAPRPACQPRPPAHLELLFCFPRGSVAGSH